MSQQTVAWHALAFIGALARAGVMPELLKDPLIFKAYADLESAANAETPSAGTDKP